MDLPPAGTVEERLRECEERLRALFDEAPLACHEIDRDGIVRLVNQEECDLLGLKPAQIVGRPVWELMAASEQAHSREGVRAIMEGRMPLRQVEREFVRSDGSRLTLIIQPKLIYNAAGEVVGLRSFMFNATARKRAERELQRAHDELERRVEERTRELSEEIEQRKKTEEELLLAKQAAEQANLAKSTFLANMSHELRTPLNAIIGYSEIMIEEAEAPQLAEFAPDVRKVHAAGKHLLSMVNDILDLSKIEAGKMDLYLETCEIEALVSDVTDTIQPLAAANQNTLELECGAIGEIVADVTKTRQCLFNLLSNACKFTSKGIVRLSAAMESVGGKEFVSFRVSDTGIGMSKEKTERLFQPFSQGDNSTTRRFGGTGLGLAISLRFCQMMGGEITAESEEGKGTTFTMRLPANRERAQATTGLQNLSQAFAGAVSAGQLGVMDGRSTVLVIDDDPTIHDLLGRYLARDKLRVASALDGKEGLKLARQIRPLAITLDVLMPGMDGWAVLSALKADSELAGIPVILVSITDNKSIGYALGAAEYLTKPIDTARLSGLLNKHRKSRETHTALVVEDDFNTREMMSRFLKKEEWSVVEAENGRVALDLVADGKPDLILLDLMMPEMDGFEFVERLRQNHQWRGIPVIVVTAKDIDSEDCRRLEGRVRSILQKGGYSCEQLLEEVRTQVSRLQVSSLNSAVERSDAVAKTSAG